MVNRTDLIAWCDDRLAAHSYQDIAVNGVQVEGTDEITRIAIAVSTSRHTINEAIRAGAQALLVHHGLLWGARSGAIDGLFADRLRALLRHDINLVAYHLPLDGHAEIGNCALLAREAGYVAVDRFATVGKEPLGVMGDAPSGETVSDLTQRLERLTGRVPVCVGITDPQRRIERAGFLTGSGASAVVEAAARGLDALVTGDVREPTMAEARELGLTVIGAGHEATERLGVQALGQELRERFGLETTFIADPNPI